MNMFKTKLKTTTIGYLSIVIKSVFVLSLVLIGATGVTGFSGDRMFENTLKGKAHYGVSTDAEDYFEGADNLQITNTRNVWRTMEESSINLESCSNNNTEASMLVGDSVKKTMIEPFATTYQNIAFKKPTSQSSTSRLGYSYLAVDGNTSGVYSDQSVTHTGVDSIPSWWMVNFGGSHTINKITLWNRTDCCSQRLSDFHIDFLDKDGNIMAIKNYPGTVGEKVDIDVSVMGVYGMRLQLNGDNFLSLAEVEVWGQSDTYEAEECTSMYDCLVSTIFSGYSGNGYINYGWSETWVEWDNVLAPSNDKYWLKFRYAVATPKNRYCSIIVNNVKIGDVTFSSTGLWTDWRTDSISVPLRKGINTIRVMANIGNGGPNMDKMDISLDKLSYEAEDNSASDGCTEVISNFGNFGRGFMDYGGNGTWIEWDFVTVPNDDDYKLIFRYAVGTVDTRPCAIVVNDVPIGNVTFKNTGSWDNWETDSIVVPLNEGVNVVRVKAIGSCGPNLDRMEIRMPRPPGSKEYAGVFFAQNHVFEPYSRLFKLISNLDALIKVNIVSAKEDSLAPEVQAILNLNGSLKTLILQGPDTLPMFFSKEPGGIDHKYDDSYTAMIPKEWIQPGLVVTVKAGTKSEVFEKLEISAPNKVLMTMFDANYFQSIPHDDYEAGWEDELEAKLPTSEMKLRRVSIDVSKELTIPPHLGAVAARVSSEEDYKNLTGIDFDGEEAAAMQWASALKAANGMSGRYSLYYVNIYGVTSKGQGGGFVGVGNGTSESMLNRSLGYAFSLPNWDTVPAFPYRGEMYGIPAPISDIHVGPTWAFDLPSGKFIPPTVQPGTASGTVGAYKEEPMWSLIGEVGDQEKDFIFRHFSDYSVNQMRNYLEEHIVVWNESIGSYASWDEATNDYTKTVTNNGVQFPIARNVQVVSVMAGVSAVSPQATIIYPPIGPYTAGLIETFDPRILSDRIRAGEIFCPDGGCDVSLKITQGGRTKVLMLPISLDPNADPLDVSSFITKAVNLPVRDGEVTKVELLSTPDAEKNGVPNNASVLYTWGKNYPCSIDCENLE